MSQAEDSVGVNFKEQCFMLKLVGKKGFLCNSGFLGCHYIKYVICALE